MGGQSLRLVRNDRLINRRSFIFPCCSTTRKQTPTRPCKMRKAHSMLSPLDITSPHQKMRGKTAKQQFLFVNISIYYRRMKFFKINSETVKDGIYDRKPYPQRIELPVYILDLFVEIQAKETGPSTYFSPHGSLHGRRSRFSGGFSYRR